MPDIFNSPLVVGETAETLFQGGDESVAPMGDVIARLPHKKVRHGSPDKGVGRRIPTLIENSGAPS